MTYILVGKFNIEKEDNLASLKMLISKSLGRELTINEIDSNPDIHRLKQEEKDSIGIEEVKSFQKEMQFKPFQERVQIGIIYNSEKLTPQSQNALLKTLEESSETSVYILLVNNEKNLLSTIRSRARIIYSEGTQSNITDSAKLDLKELDLIEKFNLATDSSESKEQSIQFLNSIENDLKSKLEIEIKNGNIGGSRDVLEKLKIITDGREKIMANCNRKLVLESIIIQLQD